MGETASTWMLALRTWWVGSGRGKKQDLTPVPCRDDPSAGTLEGAAPGMGAVRISGCAAGTGAQAGGWDSTGFGRTAWEAEPHAPLLPCQRRPVLSAVTEERSQLGTK